MSVEKYGWAIQKRGNYELHGQISREFLGLRMRNFQGIVFI